MIATRSASIGYTKTLKGMKEEKSSMNISSQGSASDLNPFHDAKLRYPDIGFNNLCP